MHYLKCTTDTLDTVETAKKFRARPQHFGKVKEGYALCAMSLPFLSPPGLHVAVPSPPSVSPWREGTATRRLFPSQHSKHSTSSVYCLKVAQTDLQRSLHPNYFTLLTLHNRKRPVYYSQYFCLFFSIVFLPSHWHLTLFAFSVVKSPPGMNHVKPECCLEIFRRIQLRLKQPRIVAFLSDTPMPSVSHQLCLAPGIDNLVPRAFPFLNILAGGKKYSKREKPWERGWGIDLKAKHRHRMSWFFTWSTLE